MDTYLIDVPMPSMGATVHELTVVNVRIHPGDKVSRGQKVAELESDKSIFDFESPCDGTVKEILAHAGEVKPSGSAFLRIETADASLKHLAVQMAEVRRPAADGGPLPSALGRQLVWTPRATKLAQEAGLDPAKLTDIEATGPGGRVSGDDVARYLAGRKQV